jgi:hypothetical protein
MGMTAMSQLSWSEERRSTPRHRTLKSAQILIDPKLPALECIVRNLSSGGALLLVPSLGVRYQFELLL